MEEISIKMMNFSTLSIRHKISLTLMFAVIASASIVAFISQNSARDVIAERMQQRELPNVLMRIRNQIDTELSTMQGITQQLATNEFLLKWLEDGTPKAEEAILIRELESLRKQYDLITVSFVDRQSGDYWNQEGFLRRLEPGPADGWFFSFRESDSSKLLSLYTENGVTKLFVNYQMKNGRGLSGVARTVNDMVERLNQYRINQSGFVFITDHSGLVKLHKNTNMLDKATLGSLFGKDNERKLLSKQDFSLIEAEVNGEKMLVASSYLATSDWYVIAQVPYKEVFAELDSTMSRLVYTVVLSAVLFSLLAFFFSGNLVRPINSLADTFIKLGQGDSNLDVRLEAQRAPELVKLQEGFNSFVAKLQKTISEVAASSASLQDEAARVKDGAQRTYELGRTQSQHTEQVATAVTEMSSTISEVANSAGLAATLSDSAEQVSLKGRSVIDDAETAIRELSGFIEEATGTIHQLASKTESIDSILDVIRSVSEQTNLLALNAAIEAARAGDHGRGFAVVADEVRTLAQRTNESTDEIQSTIRELQDEATKAVDAMNTSINKANDGVGAVTQAEQALGDIEDNIRQLRDANTQVATATEQQSIAANEIAKNINSIQGETQRSVTESEKLAAASDELSKLAQQLDFLVSSYR